MSMLTRICCLTVALCLFEGGQAQTPIVCMTAPQRAEILNVANIVANIVDNALKLGGTAFKDPAKRAVYTNITTQVIDALKNGWAAADVCDSIANPIADPLGVIPIAGPYIVQTVKPLIKAGCELRKQNLGC